MAKAGLPRLQHRGGTGEPGSLGPVTGQGQARLLAQDFKAVAAAQRPLDVGCVGEDGALVR